MDLILVESPTKAHTLTKFLGKGYRVEATMGHVRDLPKSTMGVDIEHNFTPSYIVPRDKKKRVDELKSFAKEADRIILASDPDREGEAIAWHVAAILSDPGKGKKSKAILKDFERISFHEITEEAIKEALTHPGKIDTKMVDAQQARRILDRLVGYTLSPLLWKKLSKRWLSAGRVQSVTVRLIVEREREIQAFTKIPYFTIEGSFHSESGSETVSAKLATKDGKPYEETLTFNLFDGKYTTTRTSITSEDDAKKIIADMAAPFTVSALDKKEVKRAPPAPYTTSTIQQDAGRKLYFSSKKTMQIAQKLYEEGWITYHRTDSVNLAEKFTTEAKLYIEKSFGPEFSVPTPRKFQTKSKVAQEAHEAIRPTMIERTSTTMGEAEGFNHDHVRLYDLIWKRAVGSQMREAIFDATTLLVTSTNGYVFSAQGSVVKFEGYLKILGKESGESVIPDVKVGQILRLDSSTVTPHETAPPPRYTEASLVKTLEEKDIGRPSTYAPIISTIIERQYVKKEEKKLVPTELGILVTEFLTKYFADILSLPFTATMEGKLDAIATGETRWEPVIREFYEPFTKAIAHATDTAEKVKLTEEELDEKCPTCGNTLVIRTGRYGKFVACSNFPECKYTRQYGEKADINCPKCGNPIVIKKSRRGKTFYGCSNYPACTFAAWKKEDIK